MYKSGDKVRVNKDIHRVPSNKTPYEYQHELYANEGEVIEIFTAGSSKYPSYFTAKVQMNEGIKTFRLTSLERI